jgi:hypothetical protein
MIQHRLVLDAGYESTRHAPDRHLDLPDVTIIGRAREAADKLGNIDTARTRQNGTFCACRCRTERASSPTRAFVPATAVVCDGSCLRRQLSAT